VNLTGEIFLNDIFRGRLQKTQSEVVINHATGLMWQKLGSETRLTYEQAQEYIKTLNRQQFAGYNDWRLPTLPELMFLLEPKAIPHNTFFFINPLFGPRRENWTFWSADSLSGKRTRRQWVIDFTFRGGSIGTVDIISSERRGGGLYVRGVR
jgi:hypothetical protein